MNDMDQNARDRIRGDINENFFVEAGAGSGKTTVLVDRMVAMVEGGIDISRICAITFTKAAAGEFYARFQKKLAQSDSEAARAALRNIDLCFMGTLDSFCNMVLSEHPARAGIPSDAGICEESQMDAAYMKAFTDIQQGGMGEELRQKALHFKNSFYNAGEVFLSLMKKLASGRNVHFNYEPPAAGDIDDIFREERDRILRLLHYLTEHDELAYENNRESLAAWEALEENRGTILDSWNDNVDGVLRAMGLIRKMRLIPETDMDIFGAGWENIFQAHESRGKLAWYEFNDETDPLLIQKFRDYKFAAAMDLAVAALQPVLQRLQAEGTLTFTDYLVVLRDLLRESAEGDGSLIRHIYQRHSYFLIDEFQDTNPIQAEIFFYLTAENPVADWRKCLPRKGSLFIVGDPKQSIYRFRSADVSSFLRVRGMFEDPQVGQVLNMTRNFRSSDEMCQWFNKAFGRLLPEDTEIQSRFSQIPAGEKKPYTASLSGAYSYLLPAKARGGSDSDPEAVATIIRNIMDDPSVTIQDRDIDGQAQAPRQPEYHDFMVITPTKTHMRDYMEALGRADIPYWIEGKVLFAECPALVSITYLMAAVADPFDRVSGFGARYLSQCGVSREDLMEYAALARSMTPASLFEMLLSDKRIFAASGSDKAEYVYFALELLRKAETDGSVVTNKDAAIFMEKLISDESGQERSVQLRRDSNRVHVANLHKVKGLEAPIVILADPQRKSQAPDMRVDYKGEAPEGWIFSVSTSGFGAELRDGTHPDEEAAEKEVHDSEDIRLLYVAATRAGSALIIADSRTKKGEYTANNPWVPLLEMTDQNIYDLIPQGRIVVPDQSKTADEGRQESADELYDRAEAESPISKSGSWTASYEIRTPSTITLKAKTSSEDDFDDAESIGEEGDDSKVVNTSYRSKRDAALLGTVVHRLMEVVVSSNNNADLEASVREICDEYKIIDDGSEDCDYEYYSAILRQVGTTIRSGGFAQTNGSPQDILSVLMEADEVYCELPFCYEADREEGIIWHGVMDVVYRSGDSWHIVDYKTNADPSDLDEKYQQQLTAYCRAFQALTGQEADALIYHIGV